MSARVLLLAGLAAACGGAEEAAPPVNVVLVTVDTLRVDHTSLGGAPRDTTPFLARLAEGGTVFENAFALTSWTAPSMNMILTGDARIENDGAVLHGQEHIAETFARSGYRTAGFVANPILVEELGFGRGCERYDLAKVEQPEHTRAAELVERALTWLDAPAASGDGGEKPFFLWIHPMDPHDPYAPLDPGTYEPGFDEKALAAARASLEPALAERLTDEEWRGLERFRALYDAEIRDVDRALETLWAELESRGLAENTLLVLTSDHGEGLWKRPPPKGDERFEHPFPPLYMTHGIQVFDEQVHVPLLFVGPGVDEGRRESRFVDLLDLVPTVCNLAGVAPTHVVDGAPLLGPGATIQDEPLVAMCTRVDSITEEDRWRLHVPRPDRVAKFGDAPALYDLDADPDERHPVDDPERIERMTAALAAWKEERRAVTAFPENTVAYYRALRALGYGGETLRVQEADRILDEMEEQGLLPEDGTLPTARPGAAKPAKGDKR